MGRCRQLKIFFFFKSVFQQFDYYVYGHGLLWIYPVWGSQSSLTPYIWKVFSHISLNIFSTPVFFSFHGTPMTQIQTPGYCPIDFRGPGSLFVCFNPFALYSSDWIISMIFEFTDFLFFCHLYSASKAIHWLLYYSVPKFPSGPFLYLFFCGKFPSFHRFQEYSVLLHGKVIKAVLRPLSYNYNSQTIPGWPSVDFFSPWDLVRFFSALVILHCILDILIMWWDYESS